MLKQEKKMPDVRVGDIVRVHAKIKEAGKERQQVFEGVIIKQTGGKGPAASILVRKVSQGIGVERKFKIFSPFLMKIEVKKRSRVKRADISYLRNVRQVNRQLKDRKIEPFEQMLFIEEKKEETPQETVEETPKNESKEEKQEEKKTEETKAAVVEDKKEAE